MTSESGVEYGFPDLHACEIEDKSADVLGGYSDGGSPIGIVLLGLLGLAMVVLIGGFTYNVITGKRGLQAIPGYSMLHDQLKEAPELGYSRVADK